MEYASKAFRNVEVELDGHTFVDCLFESAVFKYGGGPVSLTGCRFSGKCSWHLTGDLGRGLEVLREFAHGGGPKGVKSMVDSISASLRRPLPTKTFTIG